MRELKDTFKHKGLRKNLVQSLREKGIKDEKVLEAMLKVPRHLFMDDAFTGFAAYEDVAFPIAAGQTISQPYTVALQSQLLEVKKGDKVLEVGTGSGYQATILYELGAKVYTIERQRELFEMTRSFLPQIGYGAIKCFLGDGYKGLPPFAPFDKIIVTAGAPFLPEELIQQLKAPGILVIPIGENGQTMYRFIKDGDGNIHKEQHGFFKFVPLLRNINNNR